MFRSFYHLFDDKIVFCERSNSLAHCLRFGRILGCSPN